MPAPHPSEQAAREIRMTARTHKLENIYNECLRTTAASQDAEKRRRLRLKIVLLEQENESLREQTWQQEAHINDLQAAKDDIMEEATANAKSLETLRLDFRTKSRLVETLTAEVYSMKGLSSDSSKILSEKLALSRELSALKPQMEHLQAQLTANQNILAEKLSLERELSATQVELENEKRASTKARAREAEHALDPAFVNEQVEQLKAEVAREKREREKIERERSLEANDAEEQTALMETRLNAFRTKLKEAKDQLKEAQDELKSRTSAVSKATSARESTENSTENIPTGKKRNRAQMDPDAAIGTPGDHLPTKRGRRTSAALAGGKSTFSITPFLNKAGDIAVESPSETPSRPRAGVDSAGLQPDNWEDNTDSTLSKKRNVVQTKTNDGPSRAGKTNVLKPKVSTLKLARKSSLDQVAEENDEAEVQAKNTADNSQIGRVAGETSAASGQPVLKKKRKLLGKTVFDDDEDDNTISRRDNSIFGSTAGLSLAKKSVGKPAGKLGLGRFGGQGDSFGAFSPLKKDRSLLAG